MRGKKLGEILSDPRRDGARLKERALGFCLDKRDGLLCKVDVPELDPEDAVPVVPATLPYDGKTKLEKAPPNMTWVGMICAMAHSTPTGGHQSASQMLESLYGVVYWGDGKRQMRKDCQSVYLKCASCASGKRAPKVSARLRSSRGRRPFLKCQMDLYEVIHVLFDRVVPKYV